MNDVLNNYRAGKSKKPLFLYLALQSPHDPFEVPKEYKNMYPPNNIPNRRTVSNLVMRNGISIISQYSN